LPPFNPETTTHLQHLNVFIPLMMVGLFYILHTIYSRKQVRTREKKNEFDLMQSQIDMQEQTFQKISCEIHDNISLTLSLSKIYLHDINFNDQADVNDKINLSVCLIKKAMDDLNNLSKSLNADSLQKFGLLKSVEELVNHISKTELFKIRLNKRGLAQPLGVNDELIVFRMIQEVLNNIIRHASATEAVVWMDFEKTNLKIRICDNGIGFNPDETGNAGAGLGNLRNRAQIINAALLIESAPMRGTTVKIAVPINNNQTA
jgi:two-component system, NarL family, sensor kinase